MVGAIADEKVAIAAALIVLYGLGADLAASAVAMSTAALVGALCVVETVNDREALA